MLFDYTQILAINMGALAVLVAAVCYLLWQVVGWKGVAAFVAALLVCGFIVVPWSLQYSNMTYLMLWAMLAVLLALKAGSLERIDWELFFLVGMSAAFFDLLTAPILTLGIPLAIVLIVRSRTSKRSGWLRQVGYSASMSALWGLGYIASWSSKWVLGQLVLHENVVAAAVSEFTIRAGTAGPGAPRGAFVAANIALMFPMFLGSLQGQTVQRVESALDAVVILLLAVVAVQFFVGRVKHPSLDRAVAVLLVVPLPYLWYLVASNHSFEHQVFTYRIQAVAVSAVSYFALCVWEAMLGREGRQPLRGAVVAGE
jgi:hypothetical protein